jgi:hypothetical protein
LSSVWVSPRCGTFVARRIDRTWLCSRNVVMSDHASSTAIPSSSVDPSLLSPPTRTPIPPSVFYSQSTPNRPVTPPPNASIPTSTPISNKTSGNHSYASETHDRESANYRLAQETSGHFLGAMPPKKFLDTFLPMPQHTQQYPESIGDFENVLEASKEVNMYTPFVSMVLVSVSGLFH